MITISLCMIVKDEKESLERCLESIKDIVDEIIIVDTGSTDNTKELAKKYTENIFNFKWIDDFSAARNYSFSKATKDYILWLDADDVLLECDRKKFINFKKTLDTSVESVSMIYNCSFDKNGNILLSYRRNRLVKRCNNFNWIGAVHEYLNASGKIINSNICITHKKIKISDPHRNIKIYQKMLDQNRKFTPRDTYYYANELYDNKLYDKALVYYNKFLNINNAWYEDKINVLAKLSDYYYSINAMDKSKEYCFNSFKYDTPRAEFCCRLGYYFLQENKLKEAIFWYELACKLKKSENCWGFHNDACWTWLPHLQLCICYDKLGNHELAYRHNEIARSYTPEDENVLHNKKYFEKLAYK